MCPVRNISLQNIYDKIYLFQIYRRALGPPSPPPPPAEYMLEIYQCWYPLFTAPRITPSTHPPMLSLSSLFLMNKTWSWTARCSWFSELWKQPWNRPPWNTPQPWNGPQWTISWNGFQELLPRGRAMLVPVSLLVLVRRARFPVTWHWLGDAQLYG